MVLLPPSFVVVAVIVVVVVVAVIVVVVRRSSHFANRPFEATNSNPRVLPFGTYPLPPPLPFPPVVDDDDDPPIDSSLPFLDDA